MKNINLLFTNVGRRTYLVDFALALQKQGYPLKVFVSDVSKYTSGFWVSKKIKYFLTPLVNQDSSDYANSLLEQCKKNKINVIIPLLDFELPILSSRKNFFKDKGIEVIVSDYDVVDRCLNKKKSYYFCLENKIPVPESYFSINDIAGRLDDEESSNFKADKMSDVFKGAENIRKVLIIDEKKGRYRLNI